MVSSRIEIGMPELFRASRPFPHRIIDGAFPSELLDEAAAEFPAPQDPRWITYPAPEERGKMAMPSSGGGQVIRDLFDYFASPIWIDILEKITGIGPLTFDELGGGMHMTGPGGRLETHVDFNHHTTLPLERRINMLLFLNHGWEPYFGGTLFLGTAENNRAKPVLPLFNRLVLFETSNHSWHGHPDPVTDGHWRKSLAAYYYAPMRPDAEPPHTTIWKPA